jgi:hypothetical protein
MYLRLSFLAIEKSMIFEDGGIPSMQLLNFFRNCLLIIIEISILTFVYQSFYLKRKVDLGYDK